MIKRLAIAVALVLAFGASVRLVELNAEREREDTITRANLCFFPDADARGSTSRGCNPCDPYTVPDGTWTVTGAGNFSSVVAATAFYVNDSSVNVSETGSNDMSISVDGGIEVQISANAGPVVFTFDSDTDETLTVGATAGSTWNTGAGNAHIRQVNGVEVIRETGTGVTTAANMIVTIGENLDLADGGARPACDSTTRGYLWFDEGGAGTSDAACVCRKDGADAYGWAVAFGFGACP